MSTPYARVKRREWVDQSACANAPRFGESPTDALICKSCPVRYLCLNTAIVNNETGLWGGMTDKERSAWIKENSDMMPTIRSLTPLEPIERPTAVVLTNVVAPPKTSKELKKERAARMMSDPSILALMAEF